MLSHKEISAHLHPKFKLKTTFQTSKNHETLFFLREDLIHPSIPGSKVRKLASVFDYIEKNGIEHIHAGGSFYSNNLIALTHFCKLLNVEASFYVKETHQKHLKGNALTLIQENSKSRYLNIISGDQWPHVNEIMQEKASEKHLVVPEGAFMKEALPGLLTLGIDLLKFCQNNSIKNLFLDAGIGITAASILCYFGMRNYSKTRILITDMANYNDDWEKVLNQTQVWTQEIFKIKFEIPDYFWRKSASAKSFGAINATIKSAHKDLFDKESIRADLIYTAKNWHTTLEENSKQIYGEPSVFLISGKQQEQN